MYPIKDIRKDFPQLKTQVHGHPLIYLDSAATTLKPQPVIDYLAHLYLHKTANIHRGIHTPSQDLSSLYEEARANVAQFINADPFEIIFTKGTTEGINLVAHSCTDHLKEGDEILVSQLEHHSNILPWQELARKKKLKLIPIPVTTEGTIELKKFHSLINEKTAFMAITLGSNAIGTINPIQQMLDAVKDVDALVLVDAAQAISAYPIDVKDLDADFLVFSGHKIFAPTGIGVLWGKEELLEKAKPYQLGGGMMSAVTFDHFTPGDLPARFEAGTPPIMQALALSKALDYVSHIGLDNISQHEKELVQYAYEKLQSIDEVKVVGQPERLLNILSFTVNKVHSTDIGHFLNTKGICVRTGTHCAQPLIKDVLKEDTGLTRLSFSIYNTKEEIDITIEKIKESISLLKE